MTTKTHQPGNQGVVCYSYLRFSTPDQLKGDSLRRQLALSKDWADRNGFAIDNSLRLQDLGVSAFMGKNAKQGRLAHFLAAIDSGRVSPGSILLIESLDRLSRDQVGEALELFLGILRRGIRIVTLSPEESFDSQFINNPVQLIIAIVIMGRAYEESLMKSKRLGSAWRNKRANIEQRKLTGKCPAWLRLNDSRTSFVPINEKVKTVRLIYRLAIEGNGKHNIVKRLNAEGVKPIARANYWNLSYVQKILNDRAVVGEFQPHTGHGSKQRAKIGDPIPDYYPAIISPEDYALAQQAQAKRKVARGRVGVSVANLFTGLLIDARDGSKLTIIDKGAKSVGKTLVSAAAQRGQPGAKYCSFPYVAFEYGVLHWIVGLDSAEFTTDGNEIRTYRADLALAEALSGQIDDRLKALKGALKQATHLETIISAIEELEAERVDALARVEAARSALTARESQALGSTQELIRLLKEKEGQELVDLRMSLRARIADLISEAWVVTDTHRGRRVACMNIHFRNGMNRMVIVIAHKSKGQATATEPISHSFVDRAAFVAFYEATADWVRYAEANE